MQARVHVPTSAHAHTRASHASTWMRRACAHAQSATCTRTCACTRARARSCVLACIHSSISRWNARASVMLSTSGGSPAPVAPVPRVACAVKASASARRRRSSSTSSWIAGFWYRRDGRLPSRGFSIPPPCRRPSRPRYPGGGGGGGGSPQKSNGDLRNERVCEAGGGCGGCRGGGGGGGGRRGEAPPAPRAASSRAARPTQSSQRQRGLLSMSAGSRLGTRSDVPAPSGGPSGGRLPADATAPARSALRGWRSDGHAGL
eukprot:366404-Chlamydomonas_euryale.AAC.5